MILPGKEIKFERYEIPYEAAFQYYLRNSRNGHNPSLLFESRSINLAYGKQSIVIPSVALRIEGKNESFSLTALTETGRKILTYFEPSDFSYASELKVTDERIEGRVKKADKKNLDENARIHQPNTSYVIRTILRKFQHLRDEHAGLYGAFAYDFARNFEEFGNRFSQGGGQDFLLFLPSTIAYFDDIREKAEVKQLFFDGKNDGLEKKLESSSFIPKPMQNYEDMSLDEYGKKVAFIINEIKKGRLMQCVLSRNQGMSLQIPPIDSYSKLREVNPSPYCFYFSLGENEYLYGASPEIHIKIVNGNIEIRPIAGTIKRLKNALEDARARIKLLTDKKELREHTMLVDLARNELYRLSYPETVKETEMFTLESYPNLYHLVSSVIGKLRPEFDSLDALLTTIPAGTLSGAPKLEAMKLIEELENSRRNFYGGAIGYFSFNGNCNTGIAIRSVHVKEGISYMRAGAGIVAHSTPEREIKEIQLKSEKAMEVLR